MKNNLTNSVPSYVSMVYGWMFLGLLTTMSSSLIISNSSFSEFVLSSKWNLFGLGVLSLVMVIALTAFVDKMSVFVARVSFFAYSIINGILMSVVMHHIPILNLVSVFCVTALWFAVMGIYGYVTKKDLTKRGQLLIMALVGVVIASVLNYFLNSSVLLMLLTYSGIVIFTGLIAYDTQKIKSYAKIVNKDDRDKSAILGALSLYLDFINLFMLIIRLQRSNS